ncbi:MAG TPA: SRPBCC family protein [Acidimicrobiales bacterium]|nr:SRPBCC family protein [Acidimicrobiales bacterium]
MGTPTAMTTVVRDLPAPPDRVWAVLADPHSYQDWVVGARRIREADESWPSPGSMLHHELAGGIKDSTTVVDSEEGRRLVLRARARPAGIAEVVLTVEASGHGSRVQMEEKAVSGPAAVIPDLVLAPLVKARNEKSLRRLGELARSLKR